MTTYAALARRTLPVCLIVAIAGACSTSVPDPGLDSDGDADPAEAREARIASSVIVGSRADPRVVSDPAQRAASRRLADAPLASGSSDRASPGLFSLGAEGLSVAATDDGRALLTLLVACALPADVSLAGVAADGTPLVFLGGTGLASRWRREPLDAADRAWVSACAAAQVSETALSVPISLRGPRPALAASADERDAWTLEEGAFFGDVFADPALPLPWRACRGRGAISDPALADRVCTEEDPGHPGATHCGMIFAGSCDEACERRRGHYVRCRDAASGETTSRVVTAFLIP